MPSTTVGVLKPFIEQLKSIAKLEQVCFRHHKSKTKKILEFVDQKSQIYVGEAYSLAL